MEEKDIENIKYSLYCAKQTNSNEIWIPVCKKSLESLLNEYNKQEDIINNAIYIITRKLGVEVDRAWLYNFNKCCDKKEDRNANKSI
jgi:hypothetical protein